MVQDENDLIGADFEQILLERDFLHCFNQPNAVCLDLFRGDNHMVAGKGNPIYSLYTTYRFDGWPDLPSSLGIDRWWNWGLMDWNSPTASRPPATCDTLTLAMRFDNEITQAVEPGDTLNRHTCYLGWAKAYNAGAGAEFARVRVIFDFKWLR